MTQRLISLFRTQTLGLVALLLVLSGGAAYAVAAKNSVVSRSIKNGQVKTVDLKNGAVTTPKLGANAVGSAQVADGELTGDDVANSGLTGADLADNSVTGADINEATLGTVPNADTVDGLSASAFARSGVYKKESPLAAGNDLGDGTFNLAVACDPGDILLSGGPANVNGTSDMVESFASPGSTTSWTARIQKNGFTDNFSVVIQCLNQA